LASLEYVPLHEGIVYSDGILRQGFPEQLSFIAVTFVQKIFVVVCSILEENIEKEPMMAECIRLVKRESGLDFEAPLLPPERQPRRK